MDTQARCERENVLIRKVLVQIQNEHDVDPSEDLAVSGSAAMMLRSIIREKPIGDIDIFATTEIWFQIFSEGGWGIYIPSTDDMRRRHDPPFLYRLYPWDLLGRDTIDVNIFSSWRHRDKANIQIKEMFDLARPIAGVLTADMEWLLNWKKEANRAKDLPDIRLIEAWFADDRPRSSLAGNQMDTYDPMGG